MWFLLWILASAAGFYFGGVGPGVVLTLVVGLFALLKSGRLKWS